MKLMDILQESMLDNVEIKTSNTKRETQSNEGLNLQKKEIKQTELEKEGYELDDIYVTDSGNIIVTMVKNKPNYHRVELQFIPQEDFWVYENEDDKWDMIGVVNNPNELKEYGQTWVTDEDKIIYTTKIVEYISEEYEIPIMELNI